MKKIILPILIIIIIYSKLTFLNATPLHSAIFDADFSITFFPVGKGDCIIIKAKDEVVLVDAGYKENTEELLTYFKETNINHIKAIIATHPHKDHIGGIAGILKSDIEVDALYKTKVSFNSSPYYNELMSTIKSTNTLLQNPEISEIITIGEATLTFVGPLIEYKDTNNTSIVVKVEYKGQSILLTGDMLWEAEKDLITSNLDLSSTILKVGHHGLNNASSIDFLNAVNPKYAIITCNIFQHHFPALRVLNILNASNSKILRTDLDGLITISIYQNGEMTIETSKNLYPRINII